MSPLLALIADQQQHAASFGLQTAAAVDYSVVSECIQLLFTTPEHLCSPDRLAVAWRRSLAARVRAVVIDEAHLCLAWKHFRPAFAQLKRTLTGMRPLSAAARGASRFAVVALTGSLTITDQPVLIDALGLRYPIILRGCLLRPTIAIRVIPKAGPSKFHEQIRDLVLGRPQQQGIIYCLSCEGAEELQSYLHQWPAIASAYYHAGLSATHRDVIANDFRAKKVRVLVATVAYGLGINHADIRFVIHETLPSSVEAFVQEAGRAGRDGQPAQSIVLYTPADRARRLSLFDSGAPVPAVDSSDRERRLDACVDWCTDDTVCRWALIDRYFGTAAREYCCTRCDTCLEQPDVRAVDVIPLVRQIRACGEFFIGRTGSANRSELVTAIMGDSRARLPIGDVSRPWFGAAKTAGISRPNLRRVLGLMASKKWLGFAAEAEVKGGAKRLRHAVRFSVVNHTVPLLDYTPLPATHAMQLSFTSRRPRARAAASAARECKADWTDVDADGPPGSGSVASSSADLAHALQRRDQVLSARAPVHRRSMLTCFRMQGVLDAATTGTRQHLHGAHGVGVLQRQMSCF